MSKTICPAAKCSTDIYIWSLTVPFYQDFLPALRQSANKVKICPANASLQRTHCKRTVATEIPDAIIPLPISKVSMMPLQMMQIFVARYGYHTVCQRSAEEIYTLLIPKLRCSVASLSKYQSVSDDEWSGLQNIRRFATSIGRIQTLDC